MRASPFGEVNLSLSIDRHPCSANWNTELLLQTHIPPPLLSLSSPSSILTLSLYPPSLPLFSPSILPLSQAWAIIRRYFCHRGPESYYRIIHHVYDCVDRYIYCKSRTDMLLILHFNMHGNEPHPCSPFGSDFHYLTCKQ